MKIETISFEDFLEATKFYPDDYEISLVGKNYLFKMRMSELRRLHETR